MASNAGSLQYWEDIAREVYLRRRLRSKFTRDTADSKDGDHSQKPLALHIATAFVAAIDYTSPVASLTKATNAHDLTHRMSSDTH
jgi:hypothetical protein